MESMITHDIAYRICSSLGQRFGWSEATEITIHSIVFILLIWHNRLQSGWKLSLRGIGTFAGGVCMLYCMKSTKMVILHTPSQGQDHILPPWTVKSGETCACSVFQRYILLDWTPKKHTDTYVPLSWGKSSRAVQHIGKYFSFSKVACEGHRSKGHTFSPDIDKLFLCGDFGGDSRFLYPSPLSAASVKHGKARSLLLQCF